MEQGKTNEQRETRILDAAERLMIRYGYGKTTISDIAEEAGISKGAVYLHYSSKEGLFEDLLLRASSQVMHDLARRLESDPIGGTLAGFYSNALVSIAANPLTKALYSNDKRALGDFTRYMMNSPQYQPLMALGADFVTRCQSEGLIRRDLSAKAVTAILVALRYGFLMLDEALPAGEQASLDEIGHALGAVLQEGLNPNGTADTTANKQVYVTLVMQAAEMIQQQRLTTKGKES